MHPTADMVPRNKRIESPVHLEKPLGNLPQFKKALRLYEMVVSTRGKGLRTAPLLSANVGSTGADPLEATACMSISGGVPAGTAGVLDSPSVSALISRTNRRGSSTKSRNYKEGGVWSLGRNEWMHGTIGVQNVGCITKKTRGFSTRNNQASFRMPAAPHASPTGIGGPSRHDRAAGLKIMVRVPSPARPPMIRVRHDSPPSGRNAKLREA